MTAFTKTVTGALSFQAGSNLYPDNALFPGDLVFPYGGDIQIQPARTLGGALRPVGALSGSSGSHTQALAAVFAPSVVFSRAATRSLSGALSFAGSVVGVRSVHALTKLLTAGLRAAGTLHNNRVLPPAPGGGGYGGPMPDSFFTRYKPTLRRQR